ncbi:MAG: hypothetical protein OEV92_01210 [Nitrospinota bacterium]|nr:hypothetical protein [Nitrospinota bacterium]
MNRSVMTQPLVPAPPFTTEIVGVGATPVPEMGTLVTVPATFPVLDVIDKEALSSPAANGEKLTIYVQLAPTANVKDTPAHVPSAPPKRPEPLAKARFVTVSGAAPAILLMVSVRVVAVPVVTFPKFMGFGVTPISGAGATPEPEMDTLVTVPATFPVLDVIDKEALSSPAANGEKLTIYVQLAPTANVKDTPAHVPSAPPKRPEPLAKARFVTVSGASPALLPMVSVPVALEPTVTFPKFMGLGVTLIIGAANASPEKVTRVTVPATPPVSDVKSM